MRVERLGRVHGRAGWLSRATCKLTYRATAGGCTSKDVTCVQGCGDALDACNALTQAMFVAAVTTCTAQEKAAAATCVQAIPGGGAALDQCLTAAQAIAFARRQAALDAARPGFAACTPPYVDCVTACPAA